MKLIIIGTNKRKLDVLQRAKIMLPNENHSSIIRPIDMLLVLCRSSKVVIGIADNYNIIFVLLRKIGFKIYNLDSEHNPGEAWEWHSLLYSAQSLKNIKKELHDSHNKLIKLISNLKKLKLKKAYLFGTGPSLSKAINYEWHDGYRIVCNTIVKDSILWSHLLPNIVIAADAAYHFGPSEYAVNFRNDLKRRLSETETYFVYPFLFHEFVKRELSEHANRLIPIPMGKHNDITKDLTDIFMLPDNENVLSLALLPLGCNLSKKICLWGFDGRSPKDKGFWANSEKHTYSENIDGLHHTHPAFFKVLTPPGKEDQYALRVHGDKLDQLLINAESHGYDFKILHHSWSDALEKRRGTINRHVRSNIIHKKGYKR